MSLQKQLSAVIITCVIVVSVIFGALAIYTSRVSLNNESRDTIGILADKNQEELNFILTNVEESVRTIMQLAQKNLASAAVLDNRDSLAEYYDTLYNPILTITDNTVGAMGVYYRLVQENPNADIGIFAVRPGTHMNLLDTELTDISIYPRDDVEHVGWYYAAIDSHIPLWMGPYMNKNVGVKMVSYVGSVYYEKDIIGLVGIDLNFSLFEEHIDNIRMYDTGSAFLLDNDANIVYSPHYESGMPVTELSNSDFGVISEMVKSGHINGEPLETVYGGESHLTLLRTLRNGMILCITVPQSEIFAPTRLLVTEIIIILVSLLILAAVFSIRIAKRFSDPVVKLSQIAQKAQEGIFDMEVPNYGKGEIGVLAKTLEMTLRVIKEQMEHANDLAYTDALTHVKNKTAYLHSMQAINAQIESGTASFAVVMFDLNNLKETNDTLGHSIGDEVIRAGCKVICTVFRRSPVYRIGGDEFVAILQNDDYENRDALVVEFDKAITAFNENNDLSVTLSVARGLAVYTEDDASFSEVVSRADARMYYHKRRMKM